jgi:protein-S-isoprenylcysteine O-methyltransferase Ste14
MLACLFIGIWVADTFVFQHTTFLSQYVPAGIQLLAGIMLLGLAGYPAKAGLSIVFGEVRETPAVIRKGVFGIVRHPIYLSEILLYLGLLILSMSAAAATVWVVTIGFLNHISRYEERKLLARFGEDYAQYMREVPMWIPRPWKRTPFSL